MSELRGLAAEYFGWPSCVLSGRAGRSRRARRNESYERQRQAGNMLDTILSALLPMVFTFLLGFVAARRHDFGSKDASTLNRMVLLYAVPVALFAGAVTSSRAALSRDIPLVISLCVGIIGLYCVVLMLCRVA